MYIYIFFSNFEILPFDFLFAKYSPDISKEKSISISSTFQLSSPTFSSKISRFSFETRKHFHEFHRLSLSTLAPSLSFFLHVFVHETMHERSPICQFVIPRGCIATRYTSVALHKSRTFSRPIVRVRHCTRKPQTLQPKGKE